MCLTPGASSLATQAVAGIGNTAASIFSASADKTALNLSARIADINAASMQDNAREALRQGGEAETRLRFQAGQLQGRQIAAQAANGVELDSGSALNSRVSADYMAEVDANTIRQNAAREAAGYRMKSVEYQNEALTARAQASSISPFVAGLTSLATSAGKVAGDWYAMKRAGVPVGVNPKKFDFGSAQRTAIVNDNSLSLSSRARARSLGY